MSGYGIRRVLEVDVEVLRPWILMVGGKAAGAASMYRTSDPEARTFSGSDWVPMQEVSGSGIQFSLQLAVRAEEMSLFFERAFSKWERSFRFLVHVSPQDAKVGVWTAPGLDFRPRFSTSYRPDMATLRLRGYEDELPTRVSDAVLSLLVMES